METESIEQGIDKEKEQPFRCRIGFHKWSSWEEPYSIMLFAPELQTRSCLLCNKQVERLAV